MAKISTIGSRAQVWHGTAKKTSGGLTKSHLFMNKSGHIVSKAKHFTAKKEKRLLKHGYGTKKGVFGFVKMGSRSKRMTKSRSRRHKSRRHRGGMYGLAPLELGPGDGIAGQGITSGGPQAIAGMAGGRRHRGGSGMAPFASPGSAMWEGDTSLGTNMGMDGSNDVQFAAGMAGGRRRRHSRRHSRSRRGGTTSRLGLGQGGIPGMGSGLSSLPAAV